MRVKGGRLKVGLLRMGGGANGGGRVKGEEWVKGDG